MKKIILATLLGSSIGLLLSSCKKSNSYAGSPGCISRETVSASDVFLQPASLDTAITLYHDNGLSLQTHQPVDIRYDSGTEGRLVTIIDSRHFLNGLLIVDAREDYRFFGGKLVDSSVFQNYGSPENADSTARLTLTDLRKFFLDSDPDSYSMENIVANKSVTHWADSCIVATLVYSEKWMYDSKVSPSTNVYLKVWNIYTKSRGLLTRMAAIRDDNGKVFPEKYSRFTFH